MSGLSALFDQALVRFATSGTLILAYAIAEHFARKHTPRAARPAPPRWVTPLLVVSLLTFYFLIRPTGGALFGGLGNLLGIALVALSIALRFGRSVQHPDLAGRSLFYIGLPIAVGVPWGLVALSLPALAASLYCCHLAERTQGEAVDASIARYRMVPGIW